MSRSTPRRTHRSYDQFCAVARALDRVGDRWTLLIVRELLAGPRRYTDLHTDLPGVSTDVLASRLKDMERDGLVARHRLSRPGAAHVYALTERGGELLPVLAALAGWGGPALAERRPTDAVRAHWFAVPLLRLLERAAGEHCPDVIDVRLDEGTFHLRPSGPDAAGNGAPAAPVYGEGPADPPAATALESDVATCARLADGTLTLEAALKDGSVRVTGEGPAARALRNG